MLRARLPHMLGLFFIFSMTLLSVSCTYQSEALDSVRCSPNGQVDGERTCQNGVWVQNSTMDMTKDMRDMAVDIPDSSNDMPDMNDMSKDMPDMCVSEDTTQKCTNACGTLPDPDNCQRPIDCGGCDATEECSNNTCTCKEESDAELCANAQRVCGGLKVVDRCGKERNIVCGMCQDPETCDDNGQCNCEAELDTIFCGRQGAQCGLKKGLDNCNKDREVQCGDCNGANNCLADNTCPVCQPESNAQFCARVQAMCGSKTAMDNCGQSRTVNCGGCGTDESCNNQNTCVCDPISCPSNAECGAVVNSCGSNDLCGTCGMDEACTNDNKCTCLQATCMAGDECGSRTNACGDEAMCGTCPMGKTCNLTSRRCECTAESDAAFCGRVGAMCGTKTGMDNCGDPRTVNDCGTCAPDTMCGANNLCECVAETNPNFCSRLGAVCGELTALDNCMNSRTVPNCGTCPNGAACTNNQCDLVKLVSPTAQANEEFGHSIAIYNNIMAIGAPGRDIPDGNNGMLVDAGAVDLYEFSNGAWTYTTTLTADGSARANARFGHDVALYATVLIVGAPQDVSNTNDANAGAGYIFKRLSSSVWSKTTRVTLNGRPDSFIGTSVAIHNQRFAMGAPGNASKTGAVYVYTGCTDYISCKRTSPGPAGMPNDSAYGTHVFINDTYFASSAPKINGSGQVSVFKDTGNAGAPWQALYSFDIMNQPANALFGQGFDIDQDKILMGAPTNNRANSGRVYDYNSMNPSSGMQVTIPSLSTPLTFMNQNTADAAGTSISADNNSAIIGAPYDSGQVGAAYLFTFTNNTWTQVSRSTPFDTPANGRYGHDVAINNTSIFVSAPFAGSGAVYITPR